MDILKAIDFYLGREHLYNTEVIFNYEMTEIIHWNITEKSKPTFEQLEEIYNAQIVGHDRKQKKIKFRTERDFLLNNSDWITSRISKENTAISLGMITEEQRKWTAQQMADYLMWCAELCEAPNIMTDAQWDALTLEEIDRYNKTLFRDCPIDVELTKVE